MKNQLKQKMIKDNILYKLITADTEFVQEFNKLATSFHNFTLIIGKIKFTNK